MRTHIQLHRNHTWPHQAKLHLTQLRMATLDLRLLTLPHLKTVSAIRNMHVGCNYLRIPKLHSTTLPLQLADQPQLLKHQLKLPVSRIDRTVLAPSLRIILSPIIPSRTGRIAQSLVRMLLQRWVSGGNRIQGQTKIGHPIDDMICRSPE